MFLSDQIQTSIRRIIFSFALASCACLYACVLVCMCMLHVDALMWHPCERERLSRSVFVCLCSPILSLTLCDNHFHHTPHFSVFVCVLLCWPLYAFQSLSSKVIFKAFVQRLRGDAIRLGNTRYKCEHTHTIANTHSPASLH